MSRLVAHNLTRQTLITSSEDPAKFAELFNAYWEQLQPEGQKQIDIFNDIVSARWRLMRVWKYTTALLDMEMCLQHEELAEMYKDIDPTMRGAASFKGITGKYGVMHACIRLEEHLYRIYHRSLKIYEQRRATR